MTRAFRITLSIRDRSVQVDSVVGVEKALPKSSPLEGAEQQYGAWFTIEDAKGRPLYRRVIDNFLEGREVYGGQERDFSRVQLPGLAQTFSIALPVMAGGESLTVYASDTEKGARSYVAKPVLKVSMRQLEAMAATGRRSHGR